MGFKHWLLHIHGICTIILLNEERIDQTSSLLRYPNKWLCVIFFIIATGNSQCNNTKITNINSDSCLFLLGLVCVLDQVFDVIWNVALARSDTLRRNSKSNPVSNTQNSRAYNKQTITLLHMEGSAVDNLWYFFDFPGSRLSGLLSPYYVCGWFIICLFLCFGSVVKNM